MDDDRDPPKLSIVSSNDDAELLKQRLIDDLRWPTREMAANLMRVTRGAGRPHELPQQIINLSEAILEASKFSNAWASYESVYRDSDYTIARGALQMIASKLLHQNAQEAAGRREIDQGINEIERERERARWEAEEYARQWRAQQRVREKPRAKPRKTKKKAPVRAPAPKVALAPPEPPPEIEHTGSTAEYMKKRAAQLARERGGEGA